MPNSDICCVSCRQALFLHRQALTEQLKETEDPALVLHLTSVLLFQASTQCMLNAPGRCVPQIIGTLIGRIPTVCLTLIVCESQQSVYYGYLTKAAFADDRTWDLCLFSLFYTATQEAQKSKHECKKSQQKSSHNGRLEGYEKQTWQILTNWQNITVRGNIKKEQENDLAE